MPVATPDTTTSLFWGYTITWVLIALYALSLGRRLRKIEKSLNSESK